MAEQIIQGKVGGTLALHVIPAKAGIQQTNQKQ
jgi:hypothetical protein